MRGTREDIEMPRIRVLWGLHTWGTLQTLQSGQIRDIYIMTQPESAVVIDLQQTPQAFYQEGRVKPSFHPTLTAFELCFAAFSTSNPPSLSFQFYAQDDIEITASGHGRGTISVGQVSHLVFHSWSPGSPQLVGIEASLDSDKTEVSKKISYRLEHYCLLQTKLKTLQPSPLGSW